MMGCRTAGKGQGTGRAPPHSMDQPQHLAALQQHSSVSPHTACKTLALAKAPPSSFPHHYLADPSPPPAPHSLLPGRTSSSSSSSSRVLTLVASPPLALLQQQQQHQAHIISRLAPHTAMA